MSNQAVDEKNEEAEFPAIGFLGSLKQFNRKFDGITKEYKIAAMLLPLLLYFIFFLAFESFFALAEYYIEFGFFDWIYLTKVSIVAVSMISFLLWLLPKKLQIIFFPLSAIFWIVYGFAQICVLKSNGSMFRIANLMTGKNAVQFADSVLHKIPIWIWLVLATLLAVVVIFEILIAKKAAFPKTGNLKLWKSAFGGILFICCLMRVIFYAPGNDMTFHRYVYDNFTDTNIVYSSSDFYTYFVHDVESMVTNRFTAKKNISMIDDYFANKDEHTVNKMTGVFEGKNLLVIQLESFENSLITEESCPNLYKIRNESIVFENYYGMRFGAEPTIGNETAVNTGFYATSDYSASIDLQDACFPYSLANMFEKYGYTANVYHENNASFYNRDKTELAFGYNKYNSFRNMTDEDLVFEDDYVLADCDDLYEPITGGERFMNYFIGFSTHPPYRVEDGKWSSDERYKEAIKRHPELKEKNINSDYDIYQIFATMTDDMVGKLFERMEDDGRLDDTVILFVSDHANLTSLHDNTGADYFNIQNLPCFIYCKNMKPQVVEKVCSNIDLLPTLLNLFDIDNPGVYIGNDIFDETMDGIAYLPSLSWKTDKCLYINGKIAENYTDGEISDEYIEAKNEEVRERVEINNMVLYTEYFKRKIKN